MQTDTPHGTPFPCGAVVRRFSVAPVGALPAPATAGRYSFLLLALSLRPARTFLSISSTRQRIASGSTCLAHSLSMASMRSGMGFPAIVSKSRPKPSSVDHTPHARAFSPLYSRGIPQTEQSGISPFSSASSRHSAQSVGRAGETAHSAHRISFFGLPVRLFWQRSVCGQA